MKGTKEVIRLEALAVSVGQGARKLFGSLRATATTDRTNRFLRDSKILPASILAALPLCFSAVQIWAQAGIDQDSITGTVKDFTGALVVGAHCTLTNSATGVSQKAVTTSAGSYVFPFVNIGAYSLKVETSGFEHYPNPQRHKA